MKTHRTESGEGFGRRDPAADDLSLGLDVGSTTAKVVAVRADGTLVLGRWQRHHGRPLEVASALLNEARRLAPDTLLGVTGSIGVSLASTFGGVRIHEVNAVAQAVRRRLPDTRTVIELGGQDAKMLFLSETGQDDTEMNDRCAAGTGATFDRVLRRLGITQQTAQSAELTGDHQVSARCGVFAEADVVGMVQRGASVAEALSALARATVVQNLAVLPRGRLTRAPVVLLGGPHVGYPLLAEAWRDALWDLWRRRDSPAGPVGVPHDAALFAAMGAALGARQGRGDATLVRGVCSERKTHGPLPSSIDQRPPTARPGNATTGVHIGLDAGTTSVKAVALNDRGELVAESYGPSSGAPLEDARERLEALRRGISNGVPMTVRSLGVTGYGAELLGPAVGADTVVVETMAHLRAARATSPDVDVVVDVGGTDVKVLTSVRGGMGEFHLSNQCAAGLGAFLATTASELGVRLEDIAERAQRAQRAPDFTVGCAVFLDTDRVTFQRDGFQVDELLAGLVRAVPRNVWEFVVPIPPERLGRRFLLTGGAHRNAAVSAFHAQYLQDRVPGAEVSVHPHAELCGAIGAALEARDALGEGPSSFVGWGALSSTRLAARKHQETRCPRCELRCQRTIVSMASPRTQTEHFVLGNACERGATITPTRRRPAEHARDLLALEAAATFRADPAVKVVGRPKRLPRIGIPRVMALYRSAPLLLGYLRAAGVPAEQLLLSPPTDEQLFREGARWGVHDPCYPSKLVLSHVDWLLRQRPDMDALLMPTLTHASIRMTGTTDTAACPIVAASPHVTRAALQRQDDLLARRGIALLAPELPLLDPAALEEALFETFGPLLGISARANAEALRQGRQAQKRHSDRLRRLGARVVARGRADGTAVAVVLARPYHADPGVQHGVSTELAARGLPVVGIASLPSANPAQRDLHDLYPEGTNSGCAEKVWAARVIAADPHLVPVDLSSFRCGQDASVAALLNELLSGSQRPILRLHDLDEEHPGPSLRIRVETFIDAVRRYQRERLQADDAMLAWDAATPPRGTPLPRPVAGSPADREGRS